MCCLCTPVKKMVFFERISVVQSTQKTRSVGPLHGPNRLLFYSGWRKASLPERWPRWSASGRPPKSGAVKRPAISYESMSSRFLPTHMGIAGFSSGTVWVGNLPTYLMQVKNLTISS